jgi:hypothetical protein
MRVSSAVVVLCAECDAIKGGCELIPGTRCAPRETSRTLPDFALYNHISSL